MTQREQIMADEIKPGTAIPMSDELAGTVQMYAEKIAAVGYAIEGLAGQGIAANRSYIRAVREAHPELDEWEFRIDAENQHIVVIMRVK